MPRIVVIVVTFVTIGQLAQSAEAQWVRTGRPVERIGRFLGIGWGAGYHWRTPGPDSGYYVPFSSTNTFAATFAARYPTHDSIDELVPGLFDDTGVSRRWMEKPYPVGEPSDSIPRFQQPATLRFPGGH